MLGGGSPTVGKHGTQRHQNPLEVWGQLGWSIRSATSSGGCVVSKRSRATWMASGGSSLFYGKWHSEEGRAAEEEALPIPLVVHIEPCTERHRVRLPAGYRESDGAGFGYNRVE